MLTGKEAGREGEVMRAFPRKGTVLVAGVNMAKRHARPSGSTMQGGIIDKDMPLAVSAVAIVCHSCGPTRIGVRFDEQGRKVRVCRKCEGDL